MRRVRYALAVFALFLAACGGGGASTPTEVPATSVPEPTAVPKPTDVPPPTAVPTPAVAPGTVTSLDDVQQAVVRIVVQGTFIDPEIGPQQNSISGGSGFIIDPSGIAVTNNHVVTGAGRIKVFVGDEKEARDATVLGASECSDLAVIKIDGSDFPFLAWYEDEIKVGLKINVAGYPDGDPEYTLTDGTISRARADGNTSWASVKSVMEHTAESRGGNSGGPVVTNDGLVVGIHYAGAAETRQHFAIGRDEALKIIEQMKKKQDVASIGVNGQAVSGTLADGTEVSGVWVRSVKAGSPADKARIEPGDLITSLEGVSLATDGTMAAYCDVVRQKSESTFNVEVIRLKTGETLKGQINGRELEVTGAIASGGNGGNGSNGSTDNNSGPTPTLSDDFSGDQGIWPVGKNELSEAYITDGIYQVNLLEPNLYGTDRPDGVPAGEDMLIIADVAVDPGGRAGLSVRYTRNPNDTRDEIACWIDHEGYYGCFRAANNKLTQLTRDEKMFSNLLQIGKGNTLALQVVGDEVIFRINGQDVETFTNQPVYIGIPGLYYENFEQLASAYYDNVEIYTR